MFWDEEVEEPEAWEWTLNWNRINPKLIIGTCPCTTEDVDRIMDENGVDAFVCMQTDKEMEALDIDYPELYHHILQRGGVPSRIAITPQNDYHQAREIPHIVRIIVANMNAGRKTYLYGSEGVLRTAYALVLYLCFIEKMTMEDAIHQAGKLRPQAKSNTDLWQTVHQKHMQEETRGEIAWKNYQALCYPWGRNGNMFSWLKEFLLLVDNYKRYDGREHPSARELENMRRVGEKKVIR